MCVYTQNSKHTPHYVYATPHHAHAPDNITILPLIISTSREWGSLIPIWTSMAHLCHKEADWGLPVCPSDCTTIYTEHMQGRECPPLQDYNIVLILLEMGVGSLRQSQKPSADRVSVWCTHLTMYTLCIHYATSCTCTWLNIKYFH